MLRPIERTVGRFQPVKIAAQRGVVVSDACADLQPQLRRLLETDRVQPLLDAVQDDFRLFGVSVRQHRAKLVAAVAPDDIHVAQADQQLFRQYRQGFIPQRMAEGVVDGFEAVDVHQDQRGVVLVATTAVELAMQKMFPVATVI